MTQAQDYPQEMATTHTCFFSLIILKSMIQCIFSSKWLAIDMKKIISYLTANYKYNLSFNKKYPRATHLFGFLSFIDYDMISELYQSLRKRFFLILLASPLFIESGNFIFRYNFYVMENFYYMQN